MVFKLTSDSGDFLRLCGILGLMKKLFKLNRDQMMKLSDIFSDAGLVALATIILPSILDKPDDQRVLFGWTMAVLCWLTSLLLRR